MLKRKSKRFLSIILAAAMIVGLFPVAAFAEDGETTDQTPTTTASTLPEADENGVIKLTDDVATNELKNNVIYDLNGHTLTYTSDNAVKINSGMTLGFIDSSVADSARGGTLELNVTDGQKGKAAIAAQAGGKVYAENIDITCNGTTFLAQGKDATVDINNCKITSYAYCVGTNSGSSDNFNVKIILRNTTLESTAATPVLINVPGTLKMDNCIVTGVEQAVFVRAGNATISNCSLTIDGTSEVDYDPEKPWQSGTYNVPVATLLVGSQTGGGVAYAADAICTVTNTNISSKGDKAVGAVYVSGNIKDQTGKYSSKLTLSGEKTSVTGDIVVADSTEENPSSVIVTNGAVVRGGITNNSTASSVAVLDNATVSGTVSGDGANNVFVEGKENQDSKVVAMNSTASELYKDLATAVSEAGNGETVQLLQDVVVDYASGSDLGAINITENITLDGNSKTITAGTGFDYNPGRDRGEYHVINITDPATDVVIRNLTIDGSNNITAEAKTGARSGINVWSDAGKIDVTVENVAVKNCSTYGLTVTNGDVTIDGLTTENNVWGGINADNKQGDANLIVNNANLSENSSIVFDKGGTRKITATINGGSFRDVVMGKDANEEPITTIDSLRINGGTFKTAGIANAIDVEDYLAPGLVYNPYTGQVYKEPEYTGKYSYEIFTKVGDNGTISVDRYATEGDNVTITVSPDEAYLLDELTVTTGGKEVEVKDNGDGTYTFKMPSADAKIVVTFAEDPDWEPEPEEPAMPFTDVNDNDWFYDVVLYAYDNGLMTGVSATEFAPNQTTTRGMIVSMLARLEGVTSAEDAGFADVAANDWYATAVNWAASVGVVNGYEDNTFRPNAPITREQMAAILYNYADYKGYDVSARADLSDYADAASISSWAEDVLAWANAEGLINGMTATTIDPQGATTRAQTAAMFERFLTAHAE